MAMELKSTNQHVALALFFFVQSLVETLKTSKEQLCAGDTVEITFSLGQGNFDCTGKVIPQTLASAGEYRVTRTTRETLFEHNGAINAITMAQVDEYDRCRHEEYAE